MQTSHGKKLYENKLIQLFYTIRHILLASLRHFWANIIQSAITLKDKFHNAENVLQQTAYLAEYSRHMLNCSVPEYIFRPKLDSRISLSSTSCVIDLLPAKRQFLIIYNILWIIKISHLTVFSKALHTVRQEEINIHRNVFKAAAVGRKLETTTCIISAVFLLHIAKKS